MVDEAEFDREKREYWPAQRIRSHAMLFEAMALSVDELEAKIAREIKALRDAGVVRVSKANPSVVGETSGN